VARNRHGIGCRCQSGKARDERPVDGEEAVTIREGDRNRIPGWLAGERDVLPAVAVEVASDGLDAGKARPAGEVRDAAAVDEGKAAGPVGERDRNRTPARRTRERDVVVAVAIE